MIAIITGRSMSGKSLVLASMVKDDLDKGKKVYADAPFAFEGWEKIDKDKFVELVTAENQIHDATLALDAKYEWYDSRLSQTKLNRLLTYFVAQSRMRRINVYITAPHIGMVDVRLRRSADAVIRCLGRGKILVLESTHGVPRRGDIVLGETRGLVTDEYPEEWPVIASSEGVDSLEKLFGLAIDAETNGEEFPD